MILLHCTLAQPLLQLQIQSSIASTILFLLAKCICTKREREDEDCTPVLQLAAQMCIRVMFCNVSCHVGRDRHISAGVRKPCMRNSNFFSLIIQIKCRFLVVGSGVRSKKFRIYFSNTIHASVNFFYCITPKKTNFYIKIFRLAH